MPHDYILKKNTKEYKLEKKKINQLIYMDDIKIFIQNEKEREKHKENTTKIYDLTTLLKNVPCYK